MLTYTPTGLVADKALEAAVEYCRERVRSHGDVAALLRQNDPLAHDYLRYGLALHIGEYLGEVDPTVRAVYVCPDDPDDAGIVPGLSTPLCLIVWADPAMSATECLLGELDEALTGAYRELLASAADDLGSLLEVHLVDERAVLERAGYAALIDSLHQPATKVWQRETAGTSGASGRGGVRRTEVAASRLQLEGYGGAAHETPGGYEEVDRHMEGTGTLKRILVPLDGSPLAERPLPIAEALARRSGAELLIVRTALAQTLPGMDPTEEQVKAVGDASAYLDRVVERLTARGLRVEKAVPYGEAAEWIVEEVHLREADLIVMGTHGRTGLGRWMYGSVAESVLASRPVPVMLVPAWSHKLTATSLADNPTLVVPLDGSHAAEEVLGVADSMAGRLGARIVLVRAVPVLNEALVGSTASYAFHPSATIGYSTGPTMEALRAEAREYLDRVAAQLARGHGDVQAEVREGDAAEAIASAAREHDAALIVMATRGRTGVGRALLGSVAGDVLRRSDVPLLLVRGGSGG